MILSDHRSLLLLIEVCFVLLMSATAYEFIDDIEGARSPGRSSSVRIDNPPPENMGDTLGGIYRLRGYPF